MNTLIWTNVCLFILDPVGPMIQQNVHEKCILFDTSSNRFVSLITAMRGTPSKSASRPARSSVDEGSRLTARCTFTHHEQASQQRSDHRAKYTRSTAASGAECADYTPCHTVRKQHCLMSCYVMPEQFYSCALRRTFLLFIYFWTLYSPTSVLMVWEPCCGHVFK